MKKNYTLTRSLLLCVSLLILQLPANAQTVSATWRWGSPATAFPMPSYPVGAILKIKVVKAGDVALTASEQSDFLTKSTIKAINADGSELSAFIPLSTISLGALFTGNAVVLSDFLTPGIGDVTYTITPYLGSMQPAIKVVIRYPTPAPATAAAVKGELPKLGDLNDCGDCVELEGDLIYDFQCHMLFVVKGGKYEVVKDLNSVKVKSQQLLRMKIARVNRYLYDVKVTIDGVVYHTDAPPIWNAFFSGSSDLATALAKAPAKAVTLSNDDQENLVSALQKFESDYHELIDRQLKAYMICADLKCCADMVNDKPLSYYADQLTNINYQIMNAEVNALKGIPNGADLNSQIDAKKKANAQTLTDCATIAKDNEALADISAKLKLLNAVKDKVQVDKLNARLTTVKAELDKLNATTCDDASVKKRDAELQALLDALPLRQAVDKVKADLPSLADLQQLYLFDANLVKKNFLYSLPPLYPSGDQVAIGIELNARDADMASKAGSQPGYHEKFNMAFSVSGKWLFSFSTGPYYAFGWGHNNLPSYSWQAVPATGNVVDANAQYRLVSSGNIGQTYGLGAYANFGRKTSSNLGYALTFGGGISIESDPQPSFMAGITLSAGDEQRLNFTFGLAASQVKIACYGLYANNLYQTQPTIEYDKPFKGGFFFALSYAIFTKVSTNSSSSSSKQP